MDASTPAVFLEKDAQENPIDQFRLWFDEAQKGRYAEPNAMALSTLSPRGEPHCRMVLLKEFSREGFVFYSNYESEKGRDLDSDSRASLLFWWDEHRWQVRIRGRVEKVPVRESENYFVSRPKGSQIGAWASQQSKPIPSREALDLRYAETLRKFENREVPRPPYWGGYCLHPDYFEFWQGRENRMHDRLCYLRDPGGGWRIERLCP